jgi:quercetin dioxygenase-like cupin family protein
MANSNHRSKPYALQPGDGWVYRSDIDYVVKAGEAQPAHGAAVMEYTARKGEEPDPHTHKTEDEMFYILSGTLTFRCGEKSFEVKKGGFVFLPHGIEHGYSVRSKEPAQLLVITSPVRRSQKKGWNGVIGDIESSKKDLVSRPSAA